jgi:hypothetical protein
MHSSSRRSSSPALSVGHVHPGVEKPSRAARDPVEDGPRKLDVLLQKRGWHDLLVPPQREIQGGRRPAPEHSGLADRVAELASDGIDADFALAIDGAEMRLDHGGDASRGDGVDVAAGLRQTGPVVGGG